MILTIVIVRNNSIIHIKTPHYKGSASIYHRLSGPTRYLPSAQSSIKKIVCWVPSKTDGWEKYIPCLYKNSGKCLFEEFRSLVILALTWNLLGTQLVSRVVLFTTTQTVCPKYSFGKRVDTGATKHTGSERLGQIAAATSTAPATRLLRASTGLRWKEGAATLGHPFCGATPCDAALSSLASFVCPALLPQAYESRNQAGNGKRGMTVSRHMGKKGDELGSWLLRAEEPAASNK